MNKLNLKPNAVLFPVYQQVIFLCLLLLLISCREGKPLNHAERIKQAGEIKVGTLYGQTTYYIGKDGPTGFEYELVSGFADFLGVKLTLIPSYNHEELFPRLSSKKIDFLAASLSVTPEREKRYRFSPHYQTTSQKLVFKQGNQRPRKPEDLTGKLLVTTGSSHQESLQQLKINSPNLSWAETREQDVEELMLAVLEGEIDYTVVDSNHLAINRRVYPDLSIGFSLTDTEKKAWALNQSQDDSLYALMLEYFGQINHTGQLAALEDKYFGHVRKFNYVDTREFLKAVANKLPEYEAWFKQYAEQYGIDWRLLAAVSYQESHWNPRAISATGVRGIMMLTLPTAKQMGVKSRLDAETNIKGGARYLASLITRVPERIQQPDRLWFALAGYNLGLGHLEDARILTEKDGGDPDKWVEVKTRLPWLRMKRHYKKTRYGYARGNEAVTYVANIRRYYDSLVWLDTTANNRN